MQSNKTIILSTHDVHFAYEWADEIIVMSDGEILYHGDPVTVFHNQELLNQAHLEKPWVFETAQVLIKKQLLSEKEPMPRSKEELFARLKKRCLRSYLHILLKHLILKCPLTKNQT